MLLIAGLGNPGQEYKNTRHNIGFEVIDAIADRYQIAVQEKKHKGLVGKGYIADERVVLLKPLTYMNRSGESIVEALGYYKLDGKTQLLVISDDVSLMLGQLRIRDQGSAGGHNGLKNIIAQLGHMEFTRIKVGVGEKPPRMDLADYVLGHYLPKEREAMTEAALLAAQIPEVILREGLAFAMNQFHRKNS